MNHVLLLDFTKLNKLSFKLGHHKNMFASLNGGAGGGEGGMESLKPNK